MNLLDEYDGSAQEGVRELRADHVFATLENAAMGMMLIDSGCPIERASAISRGITGPFVAALGGTTCLKATQLFRRDELGSRSARFAG